MEQTTPTDLSLQPRDPNVRVIRCAVTGASGVIGSALRPFLMTAGHRVSTLVRRKADPAKDEIEWNPAEGFIDAAALEGMEAVVHLAGENIAERRWTKKRKAGFIAGRVESTRLLCGAISRLRVPPRVLVSASAIGFYGNRGDEILNESSAKGDGFLPDLCDAWESATAEARGAGIRVVNLRIAVVLSRKGGALHKMLTPFRWGLGGVIGTGRQYLSWISVDDVVGSIHEAIVNESLRGPVNATSPTPVTNREFVKTLGRLLRRPTVMPYPAAAIKLLFGEMGQATGLDGAKVLPAILQAAGFKFRHETIESALRDELGRLR